MRSTIAWSFAAFLGFAAFGCTAQPAPSALPAASGTRPAAATSATGGRPGSAVVIYVTSQRLFFDTVITRDPLPMEGKFQLLESGPMGLQTEFGPGDPGYLGGRWWQDSNGNGVQDAGDHFFECPLLPPGRTTR
jgi:hypothetical protein